jgi:hypothetical protein
VNYYVYYKFDAGRVDEVRVAVDALFAQISSATGIEGTWQRRRDDPSTFMETFMNVPDADAFDRALNAATVTSGFSKLGIARVTEIFQCA